MGGSNWARGKDREILGEKGQRLKGKWKFGGKRGPRRDEFGGKLQRSYERDAFFRLSDR